MTTNDDIDARVKALPEKLRQKLRETVQRWQAAGKALDHIDWTLVISALEEQARRQANRPPAIYYPDIHCIPQAELERMSPWEIHAEEKRRQASLASFEEMAEIAAKVEERMAQQGWSHKFRLGA